MRSSRFASRHVAFEGRISRQLGIVSRVRGTKLRAQSTGYKNRQTTFVSSHFKLSADEVAVYLQRKGLMHKVLPNEINLKECPFCHPHKNKVDNMWKLFFDRNTGAWMCHRCGEKGSWFDFKRRLGDVVVTSMSSTSPSPPSEPTAPGQPLSGVRPPRDAMTKAIETLENTPEAYAYLTGKEEGQRGLDAEVVRKYRVGASECSFHGEDGKWSKHMCLTFPWTHSADQGRVLDVRLKHRALESKGLQRIEPRGGAWGFFGWHTVPKSAEEVILTEGEFDAMAAHQGTGLPAISLPNGARSLPVDLLPFLEQFRRIYLWMDDDMAGQEGAEKMANKLGPGRCLIVRTRGGSSEGPKDANDALRLGLDMGGLLRDAQRLAHDQILTFTDLREEVFRELSNPQQVAGIKSYSLPSLNRILKGHRRGELTIFTGPTGSGKTSVLGQLSLDYCSRGVPTLWGSFELSNTRLAKKMLHQFAATDLETEIDDFNAWADKFEELPLYFLKFFGSTDIGQVVDAMDYAVYVHDVEHVVIDNLQFMTAGQGRGYERFEIQDRAIEMLRQFATKKNVHITLVVHPRKEDDGVHLNTSSVFGTAKATQEADNVIILQKGFLGSDVRFLDVRKNRFDGDLGVVPYKFDKVTQKVYELTPAEVNAVRAASEAGKNEKNKWDRRK